MIHIITMGKPSHTCVHEIKLYIMDDKTPDNFSKGFESMGIGTEEGANVVNTPIYFS